MDQHIPASAIALVVDGSSTGELRPAALRAKGLRPVHVASGEGLTALDGRSRRALLVARKPGAGELPPEAAR